MHSLVNSCRQSIQRDLVAELYKEDLFERLLEEDPTIAIKRKVAAEHLDVLKKAKKIVQEAELKDLTAF
jgi:dynamin 1-like protein